MGKGKKIEGGNAMGAQKIYFRDRITAVGIQRARSTECSPDLNSGEASKTGSEDKTLNILFSGV